MKQKHSFLGIISFGIGIFMILVDFMYIYSASNKYNPDIKTYWDVLISILSWVGLVLPLIALGMGIAGLAMKNQNKIFAILGVVLSILVWCVFLGYIGFSLVG